MKIFIDFDDVIFNTGDFIAALNSVWRKYNISEEIIDHCYQLAKSPSIANRNFKVYNFERHLREMARAVKLDAGQKKKMAAEAQKIIKNSRQYVFGDAVDFLQSFNKRDLYLISCGDVKFQGLKIKQSKIKKYFKEILITNNLKAEILAPFVTDNDDEEIYFLDDRLEQIRDVKKRFPQVETVLVQREEGRHKCEKDKYCDFEVKNLVKAGEIIKMNN